MEFSELQEFLDVPLKNYSSGMVARLAFAVATMTKPDILIADEILSVGDFLFQEKCEKRMAELLSGGTTVILVSHSIEQIERMCNKVAWLDHGHLRRLGPTKEVTAEYRKFEKGRHEGGQSGGIRRMAQDTNQNRPADVAQADSVGGMAKRLLNPAHLSDLARRSAATLKEQGAEQLWRDVTFRVGLAFHHDSWQHRADLPPAAGAESPARRVRRRQAGTGGKRCSATVQHAGKVLWPDAGQRAKADLPPTGSWCWWMLQTQPMPRSAPMPARPRQRIRASCIRKWETAALRPTPRQALRWQRGRISPCWTMTMCCTPNALYESVKTLQSQGAELVYSDEIVLSSDLKQLGGYHFKPDFAPDYLRGVNFITHLAVFSRALLDRAGAYESSEYDGAQDHDLMLRLTEQTTRDKIAHIKKVLYIWRGHAGSTAAGMEAKPYALAAGVRAIDAQLSG